MLCFLLFLLLVSVNGLALDEVCKYSGGAYSGMCNTFGLFSINSCDTGLTCLISDEVGVCGTSHKCVATNPTPSPVVRTASAGDYCEFISIDTVEGKKEPCDTLAPEVKICEDPDYVCGGVSITPCGAYKTCIAAPTPRPTTLYAQLNERCCPATNAYVDCGSDEKRQCDDDLECRLFFDTEWYYECKAPSTQSPSPAPTPSPTQLPTLPVLESGEVCYKCGSAGFDKRSQCPDGTGCAMLDTSRSCLWHCSPHLETTGFLADTTEVYAGTASATNFYKSIVVMGVDYYLSGNPEKSKVEVWEGTSHIQTLSGSLNSEFGASMDRKNGVIAIGSPAASGGKLDLYRLLPYTTVVQGEFVTQYRLSNVASFSFDETNTGLFNFYSSRCGQVTAFTSGGKYLAATCWGKNSGRGAVKFYKAINGGLEWGAPSEISYRSGYLNFGRSFSGTDEYGFVGRVGGITLVDMEEYVYNGKRSSYLGENIFAPRITYFKEYEPIVADDGYGSSIAVNKYGKFVLVGTGTGTFYKYDWDGESMELTRPRVFTFPFPVHFEPFGDDDSPYSFARSNSAGLMFTTRDDVVWGVDGDTLHPKMFYPVGTNSVLSASGKTVTLHSFSATSRPTPSPTPKPTGSPTKEPTEDPGFEYVQRRGRSCGLTETILLDDSTVVVKDSEVCELKCDSMPECRCFDFVADDGDNGCKYYHNYDDSTTWVSGRTNSFIKQSKEVMRVKFTLYAIDSEGNLEENTDLEEKYGAKLTDIRVLTLGASGPSDVKVVWDYTPSMHNL